MPMNIYISEEKLLPPLSAPHFYEASKHLGSKHKTTYMLSHFTVRFVEINYSIQFSIKI